MKKKILCLAMIVIMVAGASMTAEARDYQGKDGWLVDFDGKDLNSNFEDQDLTDEASNVQPGDSIELKVQIKNSASGDTDWYMANEVIQTLEDANSLAAGGAYEYRLSYVDHSNNEEVLYDSSAVGGETTASGEGLHQVSDSLKDYIYLDRLSKGQLGTVRLLVRVEGETQGNSYQQTLAKLQMKFAVEEVSAGETTTRNRVVSQVIKTGDSTQILFFCALALVSGIVLLIFGMRSMKKNQRRHGRKGE